MSDQPAVKDAGQIPVTVHESVEITHPDQIDELTKGAMQAGGNQVFLCGGESGGIEKWSDLIARIEDLDERVEDVDKVSATGRAASESESNQLPGHEELGTSFSSEERDIIPPPTDPRVWAEGMDHSTRLRKSITIFARNTWGRGWMLTRKKQFQDLDDVPDEMQEPDENLETSIESEKIRLEDFLSLPNPEMGLATIFEILGIDYLSTGNAYMEITDNNSGDPDGLWQIPSITMRVRKDERGFRQKVGTKKKYFKRAQDDKVLDSNTGKFEGEDGFTAPLALDARGHRVIHFKLYAPNSADYGVPPFVAAAAAIAGNRQSALRNVRFFENDATPRLLIVISGGTLDGESVEGIRQMFQNSTKGTFNAHRVAVIQAQPHDNPLTGQAQTRIDVIPLTIGKTDDQSFGVYRLANDEEIRESIGISKAFFTTDDVNRASAQEGRRITEEQEFEPERRKWEHMINCQLFPLLGVRFHEFKFERPEIADKAVISEVVRNLSQNGAITPNEARDLLSMVRYPENKEYDWADQPFPLTLQRLKQLIPLDGSTLESPVKDEPPEDTDPSPEDSTDDEASEDESEDENDENADGEPSDEE